MFTGNTATTKCLQNQLPVLGSVEFCPSTDPKLLGKDFYLTRLSVAEGTFKKVYNLAASGFGIM